MNVDKNSSVSLDELAEIERTTNDVSTQPLADDSTQAISEKSSPTDSSLSRQFGTTILLSDEEQNSIDWDRLSKDEERFSAISFEPRKIPFSVQFFLLFRSGIVPNSFCWFFICFGLFFSVVFTYFGAICFGDFVCDASRWKPLSESAVIVSVEKTGFSQNDSPIFKHSFNGATRSGSFFVGQSYSKRERQSGETVSVERSLRSPNRYRIQGQSLLPFGLIGSLGLLVLLVAFPTIGMLLFLFDSFFKGLKAIRLLESGKATLGFPTKIEETTTQVNRRAVQKITFLFRASDGKQYQSTVKTLDPSELANGGARILLFDAQTPERSIVFDALPRGVSFDGDKKFRAPLKKMIFPLLFLSIAIFEVAFVVLRLFA